MQNNLTRVLDASSANRYLRCTTAVSLDVYIDKLCENLHIFEIDYMLSLALTEFGQKRSI